MNLDQARSRFLDTLEIVSKKRHHLAFSRDRLFGQDISPSVIEASLTNHRQNTPR